MTEKATIADETAVAYKEMDVNTQLMELTPLTEITLLLTFQRGDKSWTKILLSNGQEAYILATTKVNRLKECIILQEQGANIYESPSIESGLVRHIEQGSLIHLLGVVPQTSNTWVKIRDYSGNEGFMTGDIRIQIVNLNPQVVTPPQPQKVVSSGSVPTANTKPGCPNCKSFNTIRHKTHLKILGWGKIVLGLFLAEIFIGVIPFYWGVIDLIKAAKLPSQNEWLCKNCKFTWMQE